MKVSFPPIITKREEISKGDSNGKPRQIYDYFSTRIPSSQIESKLKVIKDERFLFFIKYGALRRYDGDLEVIYVEIPQIPKKLVVYRRPCARMKSMDKFNLGKKDLPHIPLFEGEENLLYLSLEMNMITKIDQLISLNNLVYLNLYYNRITEIDNLQTTNKLKVLLLGKNNIDKIKNLQSLTELEILDLHSNKIKQIENLSSLKKLRILNLANNQIPSLAELLINRNLEELNIRKNLIGVIPNLTGNWEKMRKINIGKNLIAKIDYLNELKKLKNITELIIEDNPVLLTKEASPFINSLPIINKDNSSQVCQSQRNPSVSKSSVINSKLSKPLLSLRINQPVQIQNAELNETQSQAIARPIQLAWVNEMKKIQSQGYNGYLNKRYKKNNITNGHVELEGDNQLILYGDAVKVLSHEDFHNKITTITFNYFYYDNIMHRRHQELLLKFKHLTNLYFSDNNLFSFYQLIKLENIPTLENLSIKNNEICNSNLLKYFLIYRIQNLKKYNDTLITEEDISHSKSIFEYFDKCISFNETLREQSTKNETTANNINPLAAEKEENSQSTIITKEEKKDEETQNINYSFTQNSYFQFVKDNVIIAIKEIIEDSTENE